MIKIVNTPPVGPTQPGKRKSSSGGSSSVDFESYLHDADDADAPHQANAAGGANSFLFLQEISDEEVRRQKALQQGKQAIHALEQLHRDLLLGHVPESTLLRLESMVKRQREQFTDPRLQALLDEIELRAAVELAKLEYARRGV